MRLIRSISVCTVHSWVEARKLIIPNSRNDVHRIFIHWKFTGQRAFASMRILKFSIFADHQGQYCLHAMPVSLY